MIAANHGSTSNAAHATPTTGRSDQTHDTERSTINSVTTVRNTISGITGPFSSTEAAIAVQKIAGTAQDHEPSSCERCSGR